MSKCNEIKLECIVYCVLCIDALQKAFILINLTAEFTTLYYYRQSNSVLRLRVFLVFYSQIKKLEILPAEQKRLE